MSDESYIKMGKRMFILVWILIFALLIIFFQRFQNNKSENIIQPGKITITADAKGHYWLAMRINQVPVKAMIDTGATLLTIPKSLADTMGLKGFVTIAAQTANGQVAGELTRVNELQMGEFRLTNIKAIIVQGDLHNLVLLGMNVLSQFELTQKAKDLIMTKGTQ